MTREFVSTSVFDQQWEALGLSENERRLLEIHLISNPISGDVIPGTNGLRKLRIPLKGKGTRGGGRVIYVDFFRYNRLYLLAVYGKNEKADLSFEDKKRLNQMIQSIERLLNEKTNWQL
ncbi:MAG: addiction module toxin RelE [Eubacteriales bacterium]|nr:addiction module toxin RelE [Eubacteriales bacterium]